MYSYSVIQWLFFFYFYCFFGWCFESTYVSLKNKKWVNRGFMRGPFLPLYGSGGIMMLLVSMPVQDNIFLVYIAGCVGATILEYVTGVVMETLFKVKYWDYSKNKFNFQGHICLSSSLAWGFLTIFMTEFLHKQVEKFALAIPDGVLTVITLVLTAMICSDFALSFKAAMDLRDILVKMEKAKEEMLRIQKRLDVIIALTNEELINRKEELTDNIQQRKEELSENIQQRKEELAESVQLKKEEWSGNLEMKMDDLKENVEEKLDRLKDISLTKHSMQWDEWKQELGELRESYIRSSRDREHVSGLRDFFQRDLIRSNPGMSSVKFKEALEELKKRADERKKK